MWESILLILQELFTHPNWFDVPFALLPFKQSYKWNHKKGDWKKHGDRHEIDFQPMLPFSHSFRECVAFIITNNSASICALQRLTTTALRGLFTLFQTLLKGVLSPWVESGEERIYRSSTTSKSHLAFTKQAASSRLWSNAEMQTTLCLPTGFSSLLEPAAKKCIDEHMETISCLGGFVPDWFRRCSGLRWGVRTFT